MNGIRLAYQVFGTGKPLVLLHGGFGSVEMFGPNVELLAAGRRVIGVDLQSHGRSPAADRPMRFQTMADDIAALIAQLNLQRHSGMTRHRLAILPGLTHYDINVSPALAQTVIPFLDSE